MSAPVLSTEGPPPPDLRLVPAALASWGVAIAALTAGWGAAAVLVAVAGTAAVVATRRAGTRPGLRAAVVAAGGCAAAVGLVAGLAAHAVASHPLRPATGNGVWARLDVVITADPRPVRSTVPGPGRVVVRGELVGGQVGAAPAWRAGGRVVLMAPAEHWAALVPGQVVGARGRLAPPDRADLTVAVLQVRGPPAAVGPVPLSQRVAGDLRGGLRDAARSVLAEDPAGLLPGLVVGDTSGVAPGLADDFRTAGLTHLTAVSGTNVAREVGRRHA
ncbi:ComEC/Rec2 family competence protein [Actinomycetospora sp. CA-101289]|uniref:ComEC/Rec2 family competence protein n=1 Tax=Actinomycetospora sp. CA-101289 TaxID=3239893 RepID=UPI003D95549C